MKRTVAIGIGLVVLLSVVMFVAYKNTPHREVLTVAETPSMTFLKQKATECKGDFNKLSPDDQQKVRDISKGYASFDMQRYYAATQAHR